MHARMFERKNLLLKRSICKSEYYVIGITIDLWKITYIDKIALNVVYKLMFLKL